jgi:predicted PhzF superfamily epimerase YddE/YHI9
MSISVFTVDSFTAQRFVGNPAGVCILREAREADWMLNVAREMRHSETAFVLTHDNGFDIRWFTPEAEVALCGHATLATAHILWEQAYVTPGQDIRFASRSGPLTAQQSGGWIELDFPALPSRKATAPQGLWEAFGAKMQLVGRSRDDFLVLADSERAVRELEPDFAKLRALQTRGVIVTAEAEMPGFDFVSRFFAPGVGIDEDPVTGSAHCCLGPFWQTRLKKSEFVAYQASARGGVVRVRVAGDRVVLGGQAVTVLKGELVE